MRFWLIVGAMFLCMAASGQKADPSGRLIEEEKPHSPKVASWLSTIVPGAGQVYNKKYWKVPVIYAGFATFAYFIRYNNRLYIKYRNLYQQKVAFDEGEGEIDPIYENVDKAIFRDQREYWRRNRDLNYIGLGALYLLQIIDANVDAHLYKYDISDDLTLRYEATYNQLVYNPALSKTSNAMGIKLTLNF
ncbi:DUF5683 domain-containing protein [Salinivirga cyanobacteriivorans]|nr:DUF5683 domain-containing protein [Salinivirga cyanobacteriivorans]